MKTLFLSTAEKEFAATIEFYEMEMPGLGEAFIREVENSITRIKQFPQSYIALGKQSRRCLVLRFPYGIIYQYKEPENLILIIAIANLHRKPDYWKKRVV